MKMLAFSCCGVALYEHSIIYLPILPLTDVWAVSSWGHYAPGCSERSYICGSKGVDLNIRFRWVYAQKWNGRTPA